MGFERGLKVEVKNGQGYRVTEPSPYDVLLRDLGMPTDTRVLRASPSDEVRISSSASGCMLIATIEESP